MPHFDTVIYVQQHMGNIGVWSQYMYIYNVHVRTDIGPAIVGSAGPLLPPLINMYTDMYMYLYIFHAYMYLINVCNNTDAQLSCIYW